MGSVMASSKMRIAAYLILASNFVMIGVATSGEQTVLATNYSLDLTAGDQFYTVQSRAQVRSGNEIPIELQNFKVGLRVSDSTGDEFLLRLNVYEQTDTGWYQINVPAPEFRGTFAAPAEINWRSEEIEVNLVIAISVLSRF